MKRLVISVISLFVATTCAFAQQELSMSFDIKKANKDSDKLAVVEAGFVPRLEVGLNFPSLNHHIEKGDISYSGLLLGFRAGLGLAYYLNEVHYFATGLNYYMSGADDVSNAPLSYFYEVPSSAKKVDTNIDINLKNHILSIPLNYGVRLPFEFEDLAICVEGGPYLSYTLSSELEVVNEKGQMDLDEDMKLDFKVVNSEKLAKINLYKRNGTEALNRLEAGLGLSVLLEFKELYLRAGANFGLTNMYKDKVNTWKNRDYYINVGIHF